jgi:hypothetical protein
MLHQALRVRKRPDGFLSLRLEAVFPRALVKSFSVMQLGFMLFCRPLESSWASDLTSLVKLHGLQGGSRFSY